ncbi:DUF6153 family protein [Streptomyces montanisoli]|uniref:Uncharacterized protein n=1 Tax=Streptomyces montanisoli TaxID=2798581 RepID=A0A940M8V5_9ACTN|nr:DUF6153 family protein [Streptomyces montanisoli]MBP0456056.1 hypothetical protein [Streptomyces montanisoli]
MVTVRLPFGARRTRYSAGARRSLWLFVALLGLLYTHGLSPESAGVHLLPTTAVVAEARAGAVTVGDSAQSTLPVHEPGSHGAGHADGTCVSGQPPQGAQLEAPCASPLDLSSAGFVSRMPDCHRLFGITPALLARSAPAQSVILLI